MIIHQRYGIAIADSVFHKKYGFGTYQPTTEDGEFMKSTKNRKLRIVFSEMFQSHCVKYVHSKELYHYELGVYDWIIIFLPGGILFYSWIITTFKLYKEDYELQKEKEKIKVG